MSLAPFEGWLAEQMDTAGIRSATGLAGELCVPVERVASWTFGGLPDPRRVPAPGELLRHPGHRGGAPHRARRLGTAAAPRRWRPAGEAGQGAAQRQRRSRGRRRLDRRRARSAPRPRSRSAADRGRRRARRGRVSRRRRSAGPGSPPAPPAIRTRTVRAMRAINTGSDTVWSPIWYCWCMGPPLARNRSQVTAPRVAASPAATSAAGPAGRRGDDTLPEPAGDPPGRLR